MLCSVIIANRNDFIALCVTVRSALEELKGIGGDGEVIIVDSSDQDIWEAISKGSMVSNRYVKEGKLQIHRQNFHCLFTARETAIRKAKGRYIVCVDSHVLLGHNMIRDLVEFMERKNDPKIAFAHAPLCWAHHHPSSMRHDRNMDLESIGQGGSFAWGKAYNHERKISWKGMPWIIRRSMFFDAINGYGALAQHKLSWPGDPHLGIKPWLLGYENWAVPCSPGIHLGPFPEKIRKLHKYRVYSGKTGTHDNVISSMLSTYILGGEEAVRKYGWIILRCMLGDPKGSLKGRYERRIKESLPLIQDLAKDEIEWMRDHDAVTLQDILIDKPWDING